MAIDPKRHHESSTEPSSGEQRRRPGRRGRAKPRATPTGIAYARKSNREDNERRLANVDEQHLRNEAIAAGAAGPLRDAITLIPKDEAGEHYTDDGISAARNETTFALNHRPDWEALLAAITTHEPDYAIAIRPDRWARDIEDILRLIHTCRRAGTKLLTENEVYDLDDDYAQERLKYAAIRDEGYVKMVRTNILGKFEAKRSRGELTDGRRRYGLEKDHITIRPDEAKWIREMARLRIEENRGYPTIAQILNEQGSRTITGKIWKPNSVLQMLNRAINIGWIEYKGALVRPLAGVTDGTETILDRATFDAIIARAGHTERRGRPPAGAKHLLTGVLYCASCMGPMAGGVIVSKRPGSYYRCRSELYPPCPAVVQINQQRTDAVVREATCRMLADKGQVQAANQLRAERLEQWRALRDQHAQTVSEWNGLLQRHDLDIDLVQSRRAHLLGRIDELALRMAELAPEDGEAVGGTDPALKEQTYAEIAAEWDHPDTTHAQRRGWILSCFRGFVVQRAVPGKRFDPARIVPVALGEPFPEPST